MKRLNFIIRYSLIVFLLSTFQKTGVSQCLVDYTTYNYFCDLDTLILEAVPVSGVGPFSFIWETGETTQSIFIPLALGDYMLTMTDANGCVSIINCHIKPFPPVLYYPYNQNACEGDTVTLFLEWFRDSLPGATYLWSTGETTPTIQITDDIVWSVTVTDPATGCTYEIPPGLFDFHPTPYPTIVGPAMICPGETVTLTVTGGPFGSLYWLPGEVYAPTLDITEPGIYTVYGFSTEAGYCWHLDTILILPGDIPPPILTGPPELCPGQNGTINITNSPDYTGFLWSDGQTTSSISVNQPGTYTVTVTNSGGCTAIGSYTVSDAPGATLTTTSIPSTCGMSNGSINLTTSPPGTYTFTWSNGSSTEDLNNIPGGTYSVTVTSLNGCVSTTIVDVPDNPIIITMTHTINHVTSCIVNNGSIDINISPSGSYTYQWSNGATTEDLINLAPGTYSVTVTTGINCSATGSFTIDDIASHPDIQSVITAATCGESNGSITTQVNNGVPPYTYLWSNGSNNPDLVNIPANTYSITITGSNGCTSSAIIDVPDNEIQISISGEIIPNTSCSSGNGSIDITLSPPGSYSFLWSNGNTSEDLIDLNAGTYQVTATIGNNCTQTGSFIVMNENIPFSISGTSFSNTSCTMPNGAIDLLITPSGNYTYSWSTGSTNEDLQNLDAGSYSVTVTNIDGCSISSSFEIVNALSVFNVVGVPINNTSCQAPNGSVDITIIPSGTYIFLWSNGEITEDLQNLPGGLYGVTISDANGCTADTSFIVADQSANFSISATSQPNSSCTNPNGSIDVSVNPGGIYTFLWSNGATTEDLQFLSSGVYSVTVSDINQCLSSNSFIIMSNVSDPIITSQINPETCGTGNGGIDLTTLPVGNTFLWPDGSTSEDLQNIIAGVYTVTVTGINGCTIMDTFTVDNINSNFNITAVQFPNTSCTQSNGSLDLSVSPVGVYTFIWSNGQVTEDLQNLTPGQYQVTVTDQLNCSSILGFTIDDQIILPTISELITAASCGSNNGRIDLTISPAIGNTFTWSNGSVTEDLINIYPGNYSVTVTDLNGCSDTASFTVPNNSSSFSVNGITTPNTSCNVPNGAIDLTISPGGIYTYAWSTGDVVPDLQSLSPGIYIVTVTDGFNCSLIDTFIINANSTDPVITSIITPAMCGQNNGSIDLTVTNTSNNSFLWSNGSQTEDLSNISPGTYDVTVTAPNGCYSIGVINVPNLNSNFSIGSAIIDDNSCTIPNGTIDLTVTPLGQYLFSWSNGQTTEDLLNLSSGIYTVTVTDQYGCFSTETFSVENISISILVAEIIKEPTCGQSNGSIFLEVNPATGNTYLWSNGETGKDLNNVPSGNYSVIVTNVNGCTFTGNYLIPDSEPIILDLEADLSSINIDGTVTCSLQLNVPMESLDSIFWSPVEIMSCHDILCLSQTFTLIEQTEIFVLAMDTNGCMGTARLMLDIEKEPDVFIPNVFSPNGDDRNDMFTVFANEEVEQVVILEIFDRWGNKVFTNEEFPPNELNYGWDGVFRGQLMNPAVFAYRAVVRLLNGNERRYKGDLTLVR